MTEKYGKDWLVKEIAARASFTQGDVKEMFDTFEEIVEEVVASHDELVIGGLFKVYSHKIDPHTGFDLHTGAEKFRDTTYRLTISPSPTLKRILKNSKPSNEEEIQEDN